MNTWSIRPHDSDRISALERAARIPAVLAQILVARRMDDPEAVRSFLNPKLTLLQAPESLPGCLPAAGRIVDAIRAHERMAIFGDYDTDGVTGTAGSSNEVSLPLRFGSIKTEEASETEPFFFH